MSASLPSLQARDGLPGAPTTPRGVTLNPLSAQASLSSCCPRPIQSLKLTTTSWGSFLNADTQVLPLAHCTEILREPKNLFCKHSYDTQTGGRISCPMESPTPLSLALKLHRPQTQPSCSAAYPVLHTPQLQSHHAFRRFTNTSVSSAPLCLCSCCSPYLELPLSLCLLTL